MDTIQNNALIKLCGAIIKQAIDDYKLVAHIKDIEETREYWEKRKKYYIKKQHKNRKNKSIFYKSKISEANNELNKIKDYYEAKEFLFENRRLEDFLSFWHQDDIDPGYIRKEVGEYKKERRFLRQI